jgi:hypothetical protein
VRIGELLGLTEAGVEKGIKRLRELGFVATQIREDDGTKKTIFDINLGVVRTAKNKLCANKGVRT